MLRLAPTVVSLTMSAAGKANLIWQPGRFPCVNDLPSSPLRGVSGRDKRGVVAGGGVMSPLRAEALDLNCVHIEAHLLWDKAIGSGTLERKTTAMP